MLDSTTSTSDGIPVGLTPREQQVLAMTARGLTNQQIAAALAVSIHAVKFHLATIYRKLHVSNRTEAAFLYLNGDRAGEQKEGGSTS